MSSSRRTRTTFQRFIDSEASGGVLLMGSTALALAVANTFLGSAYEEALHARVAGLDLRDWINDGLMTFFFLLVGLEIKREMVEGQLDTWPRRVRPALAAAQHGARAVSLGGLSGAAHLCLFCRRSGSALSAVSSSASRSEFFLRFTSPRKRASRCLPPAPVGARSTASRP